MSLILSCGASLNLSGKMKFALVQQASDGYTQLLSSVIEWHSEYAKRHDILYKVSFGDVVPERNPNWGRFPLLIETLKAGYADVVIWMDADTVIADENPNYTLRDATDEFLFFGAVMHPEEWHDQPYHMNMGVMFLRNCERTIKFLEAVNVRGKIEGEKWENQGTVFTLAQEQKIPICRVSNRWNSTVGVNDCDRPVIRAYHGTGTTRHAEIEAIAKHNMEKLK